MTGHKAGHVQVLLRGPPHRDFLEGFPGIVAGAGRPPVTVKGTVEVRTSGTKAKWVRVWIKKCERVPSSGVGKGSAQSSTGLVGAAHDLWKPQAGKEFDMLFTADFDFILPFPVHAPPTTEQSGCNITYELVAAVCHKGKGGLFRKDVSQTVKNVAELRIVKYELASAWPVYNQLEQRTASALNGAVSLVVDRPIQAFGPGDRIVVTATMKSEAQNQFRLKGFEMSLVEILTIHPPRPDPKKKAKAPSPSVVKRQQVCTTRVVADGLVVPGGERGARLDLVVPQDRQLLTVRGATDFQVEYELVVEATCDGGPSKVILGGMQCIIGTLSRSLAQSTVKQIGFVQGLCPRPPLGTAPQLSPSIPGSVTGSSNSKTGSQDNNHFNNGPTRGHQSSMSADGFLAAEPNPYYRPQSMNPPPKGYNTPSPPPAMPSMQLGYQQMPNQGFQQPYHQHQQYQQHQAFQRQQQAFQQQTAYGPPPNAYQQQNPYGQQQPQQGFVPRDSYRRTSTGTTTTTTTSFTDHGPMSDRNVATMPVSGRTSIAFPSPNLHRATDAGFGPMVEEAESMYHRPQSDIIPHGNSNRFSAQGTGTFGQWNVQNIDRLTNSFSPTTTMIPTADEASMNQSTARPESINTTPTRATAGWVTAANEKQRLYEQARDRAANSQAEHGRVLSDIGMEIPSGAPPEYTPPPKPATPMQQMQAQSTIHDSPQSIISGGDKRIVSAYGPSNGSAVSPVIEPPSEDPVPYQQLFGPSASPGSSATKLPAAPLSRGESPAQSAHMSAAEEKDIMRQRYEAAQAGVARFAGNQNGHISPQSTGHGQDLKQSSRSIQQQYMGAADEKDMMRRRYEEAKWRVDGAGESSSASGAGQSSVAPSTQTPSSHPSPTQASPQTPKVQQAYMSAADEKDMMRRRYEDASNAVNRAAGSSPQAAGPSNPVVRTPEAAAYMSAAAEKELMRKRYEEATTAVSRAVGVSAGPSTQASPATPTASQSAAHTQTSQAAASPVPAGYMSAVEEKEMMRRRYEEATNAVNRSAETAGAGPSSAPVDTPIPSAYMSAEQEKEMMRKRYEDATNAVNRAAELSPSPASTAQFARAPSSPPAASTQPGPSIPAAYMSAEQEKEMMRKRYEDATNAVNRAAEPSPSQASTAQFAQAPSSPPAASTQPGPPIPAAYMSAEQEKEMMRKRYEDATSAVNRAAGMDSAGAGPSSAPAASSSSAVAAATSSSAPSDQPVPYDELFGPPTGPSTGPSTTSHMSAADEKDAMRLRYEEATNAMNRAGGPSTSTVPQRSMTLRERMMSALPDGPPPPLAPRPPREYVEMLEHRNA